MSDISVPTSSSYSIGSAGSVRLRVYSRRPSEVIMTGRISCASAQTMPPMPVRVAIMAISRVMIVALSASEFR